MNVKCHIATQLSDTEDTAMHLHKVETSTDDTDTVNSACIACSSIALVAT